MFLLMMMMVVVVVVVEGCQTDDSCLSSVGNLSNTFTFPLKLITFFCHFPADSPSPFILCLEAVVNGNYKFMIARREVKRGVCSSGTKYTAVHAVLTSMHLSSNVPGVVVEVLQGRVQIRKYMGCKFGIS